ncbi:MAG: radical SAM protein [Desulfobacteraceae bacterium]|jgi:biotin synthase|nr:MAG: radical SAM protein [Desulfobacteraceae bacterium]
MTNDEIILQESPDVLRMSLAAAMTLGIKPGLFYRNAKLYCINLLLTYKNGCAARCAYCGLSSRRPGQYGQKSFIRVSWPVVALDEIIGRIGERKDKVKRICISMITNRSAREDTFYVISRLRSSFDIPVSVLISPTIVDLKDLENYRDAGADRIGVAIDLATRGLFDRYRGKYIGGPHNWERYWECLEESLYVFGKRKAGSHFMVGMGETEKEMCEAIQRVRDMGGWTHLFSFFPEPDSPMCDMQPPPIDQYRRIQLARYLIDNDLSYMGTFAFDQDGKIVDFGEASGNLDKIVDSGEPFRTSGCEGYDGEVACNRPYANSRPGPYIRNYPFPPERPDILRIRKQMGMRRPPVYSFVKKLVERPENSKGVL